MTTKIGSVYLEIEAKMTKLEADLAKANRTLSRFDKDARAAGGRIEGAFKKIDATASVAAKTLAGFAAGIGVGLLQGGAKAILDFADNLATAADQANISVTRYQTLKGAFRSLEVDAEDFDKILRKLITTQGDVASGAENAATKAFDKLGISAKIMSGEITTTDGLIDALAISLGDIEDPSKRASIAADIVSQKLGPQLAAAIGDGGKALKKAETDFTNTGKVIDEQMIEKLADANEKWDSFVENIQSKSVIFAASAIGAFEKVGDAIDRFIANSVLASPFAGDEAQMFAQDVLIKQHRAKLDRMAEEQQRAVEKLNKVRLSGLDWLNPKNPIVLDPDPDPAKRTRTAPTKPTFSPADLRLGNDLPPVELPISLDVDKPLIDLDKMNVGLEGLRQRVTAADIALADTFDTELFERVQNIGDAFEQDVARSLADIIVYGDSLGDSMEQAFKRMASAMLEAVIQAQVLKPLLESMGFSSGGGAFTSIFGGFFADGGRPPMGKVSVVGERGPELFVPDFAGRILPNEIFANMGGGGGGDVNSITINAPGATAETVQMIRRELVNALPIFQKASFAYTQNRVARNRHALARGLG